MCAGEGVFQVFVYRGFLGFKGIITCFLTVRFSFIYSGVCFIIEFQAVRFRWVRLRVIVISEGFLFGSELFNMCTRRVVYGWLFFLVFGSGS